MKNLKYILLFSAIIFAIYEQSKTNPNKYFILIAIAIFGFQLVKLMTKIPSKKSDQDEQ